MIELLLRLAISMAVVMAVMGLAARFVRRRQEAGLGGGGFAGRRAGRTMGNGRPGTLRSRGGLRSGRPGAADGGAGTSGAGGASGDGGARGAGGASGAAGGPITLANRLGSVFGAPRPRRARPIPPVEVVYRRALAKNASVAVIQATGKQYLLGVTEQSITLLAELPDADAADAVDAPDATPLEADIRASKGAAAEISDLEVWDDHEDWQQADRMPASPPDASNLERQNAWKLTLDSLRERTIRR